MTKDKNIFILNIYFMLTYAFRELKQNNYEEIAGEDFDNIQQLFAEILIKGISCQLKQGILKQYIIRKDSLPTLRGKLDLKVTIPSNPQPIGFSGILLAKRQNSFYCTYFLHNRNVADTKSPYPIKRLEVIRWFNQKSMVFNQSLS